MSDYHKEPQLTIWDWKFKADRTISAFEKTPQVDMILGGFDSRNEEAIEKFQMAEAETDIAADAFQDALNLVANKDWDGLLRHAEEFGVWDDSDYDTYNIKRENGDD